MVKFVLAVLFSHFFLLVPALAETSRAITICVDTDPPPPNAILRDANGKKIIPIDGASVDIVRAAFVHLGLPVEFHGDLPWNRCLKEVEQGDVDFALGAYFNEERAKIFDYSTHYSTLTPQVFYLTSRPVVVSSVEELKKFRGCGIYGSSYAHYQLDAKDLDLGSDYDSLYRKLLAYRCDYFVEELEAVYDSSTGKHFLTQPLLRHYPASWAQAPARHLVTAKNSRNSALLLRINAALDYVIQSGQAEAVWKKDMGDMPFKP
jgi:polar amino acid transport system substrate-binding protein